MKLRKIFICINIILSQNETKATDYGIGLIPITVGFVRTEMDVPIVLL